MFPIGDIGKYHVLWFHVDVNALDILNSLPCIAISYCDCITDGTPIILALNPYLSLIEHLLHPLPTRSTSVSAVIASEQATTSTSEFRADDTALSRHQCTARLSRLLRHRRFCRFAAREC